MSTAAILSDPRWAALCERSRAADGTFFFSVKTTGIYCRPSCGARRPRPENVAFHATAADAEAAGFRGCKRCAPDAPDRHAALVSELCRWIEASPQPPGITRLSARAGLSPSRLARVFKDVTGLTPKAWA